MDPGLRRDDDRSLHSAFPPRARPCTGGGGSSARGAVGGAVRGRCVERKRGPRCTPAAVAVAAGPRPDDLAVGAAGRHPDDDLLHPPRSEEHTSELQSLMRISYAVFCLKKKN